MCYLRAIRVNQGPIKDQLGCPEASRRLQVPLQASMNINLFTFETHIVSQISQLPEITQKWFCIQNLPMNLSFQGKKTVCNFVAWFTSYSRSCDIREFLRFFLIRPVANLTNLTYQSFLDMLGS